jgi:hypothetical protein
VESETGVTHRNPRCGVGRDSLEHSIMLKWFVRAAPIAVAAVVLAGCATTTLQSTWSDPGFMGGPFRKVFVVGLSARDITARRVFEDVMVAKLVAAGVQAVPAWQYLKVEEQADEGSVAAAVEGSGADAVLMARLLGVDTRISVTPGGLPGPGFGWYGGYAGWYAAPMITQYEIAIVETTVYDARTRRLVWSATSETFNPASVQKDAPGLADAIIAGLRKGGLLPAANP